MTRKEAKVLLLAQGFANRFSLKTQQAPFSGCHDLQELTIRDYDPENQPRFDASVLPSDVRISYRPPPGWQMSTRSGPGEPMKFFFKKAW